MKAWEEFSKIQKWITGISATMAGIVAIGVMVFGGYDHFATKSYADEGDAKVQSDFSAADQAVLSELHTSQDKLTVASNRAEIWRAKREIKRLERDQVDAALSPLEKGLITSDIKEYNDLISCIRDGKELCY